MCERVSRPLADAQGYHTRAARHFSPARQQGVLPLEEKLQRKLQNTRIVRASRP